MSRKGEDRRRKRSHKTRPGPLDRGKVAVRVAEHDGHSITQEPSSANPTYREPTDLELVQFHELLESLGVPLALSGVSFYRFTRLGEAENRRKPPSFRIEQFHAELLQAIALGKPSAWHAGSARREDIEDLLRLLALLPNAGWKPSDEFGLVGSDAFSEVIRGETRFVRNWAHPHQLLALLRELFEPLDAQYRESFGVGMTDLVSLFERIMSRLNERSERFVRWHNALSAASPTDWVGIAREFWAHSDSTIEAAAEANDPADRELVLHAPLPDLFTWSLEELGSLVGSGTAGLRKVIDAWSLHPDHTPTADLGRLMLDNPVWARPFVQLDDDRFFLPFPSLLYSFGLQLLESACALDEGTYRRYVDKKWRSRFLERRLGKLLSESFGGADLHLNNAYPGGQNDMTLRIDDFVLVIEAKSGRVAKSARRGGIESIRRAMKEIVLEGSEQAYRFIEFLRDAQSRGESAVLRDGRQIDVANVAQYIPCVVHLEPLGRLGADTKRVRRLFPDVRAGNLPAMAIALADFETILTLLGRPEERLHYLYRRRQLELRHSYSADEMDLLAMYFDNQLNFDERFPKGELLLYGKSTPVDRWLSRDQELTPVPRPRRRMSRRFKAAIERIAGQRRPGWLRMALILQDVFDERQRAFEHQIRLMIKTLRRGSAPVVGGVVEQGLTEGRFAFSYLIYSRVPRDGVRDLVMDEVSRLVESDTYAEALVIAIDGPADSFPYSLIAGGVRAWTPAENLERGTVLG